MRQVARVIVVLRQHVNNERTFCHTDTRENPAFSIVYALTVASGATSIRASQSRSNF